MLRMAEYQKVGIVENHGQYKQSYSQHDLPAPLYLNFTSLSALSSYLYRGLTPLNYNEGAEYSLPLAPGNCLPGT